VTPHVPDPVVSPRAEGERFPARPFAPRAITPVIPANAAIQPAPPLAVHNETRSVSERPHDAVTPHVPDPVVSPRAEGERFPARPLAPYRISA